MNRILVTLAILINLITYSQAQWQRQYPMDKLEEVLDIVVRNDGYGFATGADDLVLRFNNGTKEWIPMPDSEFGWTLFAVDYLEGSGGEYVAAGGTGLIVSENGGSTWTKIQDAPAGIMKVKILDEDLIIVIAGNGVHRWNGVFWSNLNAPPTSNVIGGQILDVEHIWAYTGGSDPRIYYTSNAGQNWANNDQIDRPDGIAFYDASYGVAFDNRIMYESVNGGVNWTQVSSNAIHNSISDVTFGETSNILMAATLNGDPAYTTDGGETWDPIDMDLLIGRNFSIANVGSEFWVGNDLSSIGYTPDDGGGWSERSGPRREPFHDIHFTTRNIGVAVGFDGALVRTTNGGAQWEDVSFETDRTYWSVDGLSPNALWIGAQQRIFFSSDTGQTWSTKATFLGGNINDILAVSSSRILAVSSAGIIYRSNDAGSTWDTVHQVTTQLRSIAKIDNQRYMATGFNGIILRSADQGETWSPLLAPVPALQYEQSFFLDNDGWLITSSFRQTMWHTSNGGDNWNSIALPIDRAWYGVYFITQDTGIVVGSSTTEGRAYITYNGGQTWEASYTTDFQLLGVSGVPNPNGTAWIHGEGADIEILPYCNTLPEISNLQGNASPCEDATLMYIVTGENVGNYYWTVPSDWDILNDPNNDTIIVEVGLQSGQVSVTGANACGFTNTLTLPVTTIPTLTFIEVDGSSAPCQGDLEQYTIFAPGFDFFDWNFPGPDWQIISVENATTVQVLPGISSGYITVVSGNACGTVTTAPLEVNPNPLPVGITIGGETTVCEGTIGVYTFNGEHYTDVAWSVPIGWTILAQPTAEIVQILFNTAGPGVITATGINDCGFTSQLNYDVMVATGPHAIINTTPESNILTVSFTGNASSIQWYLDGNALFGATSEVYEAVESGNYTVEIILDSGCAGISPVVNVTIVSIDAAQNDPSIQLTPVPAKNEVAVNGLFSETPFDIIDLHGRVVMKGIAFNTPLNVSSLSDGLYTLKLQLPDKIVVMQLLIVE